MTILTAIDSMAGSSRSLPGGRRRDFANIAKPCDDDLRIAIRFILRQTSVSDTLRRPIVSC